MKNPKENTIKRIESEVPSNLQYLLLQTSLYAGPSGEVCTLDVVSVSSNSALVVDCTSNGTVFDPQDSSHDNTKQKFIHEWERIKTIVASLDLSHNPDISALPTSVYARLDEENVIFKIKNSGGLFAIELVSSLDPLFPMVGIEVHEISLVADQENSGIYNEFLNPEVTPSADVELYSYSRRSSNKITSRHTIGLILVTDGITTVLEDEKKYRFGGEARDIAMSVVGLLNQQLYFTGDDSGAVLSQFQDKLANFQITKTPLDDLTLLAVIDSKKLS